MSIVVIATIEELRLLTKQERRVYEMYRLEGKTKEAIIAELNVGKDAFRRYWWSAIKKIIEHRRLTENPQHFLAQGRDILGGDVRIGTAAPADARTISNTSKLGREPVSDLAGEGKEDLPDTSLDTSDDTELAE